tara:strand:+ start:108 stop:869 length:762 start_codon:yes stop_codon:yes gene_type:complete
MVGAAKPRVRYKCVAPRRRSTTQTAPPPQYPASSPPIDKKIKKKKRDKKKKKKADDDDDKEEKDEDGDGDDEDKVYRRGTAVYFIGDITTSSVTTMRNMLDEACNLALKFQNTIDKPSVVLYIHSYGGDLLAGFSAYSAIKRCAVPVTTVADGYVASAATFLLLAGRRRFIAEHTHVLIHQLSTGVDGTYAEVKDDISNCDRLMASMKGIYEKETTLSAKKVKKLLKSELDLTADECIKHGVVSDYVPSLTSL